MALVLADRVQETSTTTGTGTLTLAGAVAGFQSFSVIGNANTTYYCITEASTGAWEVGTGTYTSSGTTLSRTTVFSSSNANALVNFTSGALTVFCDYPASRSVTTATLASPPSIGNTTPGSLYSADGGTSRVASYDSNKKLTSAAQFTYQSNYLTTSSNGLATGFTNFFTNSYSGYLSALGPGTAGQNVVYLGPITSPTGARFGYNVYYDGTTNSADTFDQNDAAGTIDYINNGGTPAWQFKLSNTGTAGNPIGWFQALQLTTTGTTIWGTAGLLVNTGPLKASSSSAGVGYASGAGSTQTQATNKSTGVTLNNICGQITMNAASLAASTSVSFTLTNSAIAATDVVIVNAANVGGAAPTINTYQISVDSVLAGSCRIHIRNVSAASASQAIVLNFAVIKSVAA